MGQRHPERSVKLVNTVPKILGADCGVGQLKWGEVILLTLSVILWHVSILSSEDQDVLQRKTGVFFTLSPGLDTFEASVKGTSIKDYVITYRIIAYDAGEIYSFTKKYASIGVDPPGNKEGIRKWLERDVANPCSKRSGSLPTWNEVENQGRGMAVVPKLSKSDYNRLRGKNLPLCAHPSGYERYRYVVYDPLSKEVKVIAEVAW